MKPLINVDLAEKITSFVMEEARRLSVLMLYVIAPLAVIVFGAVIFK